MVRKEERVVTTPSNAGRSNCSYSNSIRDSGLPNGDESHVRRRFDIYLFMAGKDIQLIIITVTNRRLKSLSPRLNQKD